MKTLWLSLLFALALGALQIQAGGIVRSVTIDRGPTPFISLTRVSVTDASTVSYAEFQIQPKAGSATRPIDVRYARSWLEQRGYIGGSRRKITVPVFGLYAGRANTVTLTVGFNDGTSTTSTLTIKTLSYDGGTYSNPTVVQPRLPGTTLSYDFIMLKSYADPTTPIIIDSDAEIRWIGTAGVGVQPSILFQNAFYLTSGTSLLRTDFDGTTTTLADYSSLGVTGFHHNIDPGRDGMILDADTVKWTESVNYEVDTSGNVLRSWAFGDIISAAMSAGGDNPQRFVKRAPTDWFHNNATTYRASDNSLIVSSRENFVIAVDYDTSAIKWIMGDPTKLWYSFPSLRQFALTLGFDTLPPIGQHAVSMPGDQLLLFDDG
ncbi:MAG: aryl-sulfate sulfotransferase, partial [Chthoniobacterales bacterium]